jgi:hypothetical protein
LKKNIKPLNTSKAGLNKNNETIGLDLINSIEHYSFDYNENSRIVGGKVECGYIAQQLQSINPNLVRAIDQEDGSEILSPREDIIIPYLSKAIQEQSEMIKRLELKIEALEKAILNKN